MVAVWALVVLACIWIVVGLAVLVGMAVYLRSRGEESDAGDDWMDIADVVSDDHAAALRVDDDHYAEDYADDGVCLEGFTPEQTAVLRANYLPLCDDERIRLGVAFLSIMEGADR